MISNLQPHPLPKRKIPVSPLGNISKYTSIYLQRVALENDSSYRPVGLVEQAISQNKLYSIPHPTMIFTTLIQ